MGRDSFYTPQSIATEVAEAVETRYSDCIADYAAGNGRLLKAVGARFRSCTVVGMDIDSTVIRRLRRREPGWVLSVGNFLRNDARRIKALHFVPTAVVLNPPYSCRGNAYHLTPFAGRVLRSGLAAAFILRAVQRVSEGGVVLAVLPEAFLYSEKDTAARDAIATIGTLKVLKHYDRPRFEGCSVRLALIRIEVGQREAQLTNIATVSPRVHIGGVSVLRGGLPVFLAKRLSDGSKRGLPFLHTTSLASYESGALTQVVPFRRGIVRGPGVALPRVGVPLNGHFRVVRSRSVLQLSDCIMFLRVKSTEDARALVEFLLRNRSSLAESYRGTGARYITTAALKNWLTERGVRVSEQSRS